MAGATSKATARQALEEERDYLLRSLDDLDAELAAGDLDPDDYEALRDSYTQRAAHVLRQLGAAEPAPAAESASKAGAGKMAPSKTGSGKAASSKTGSGQAASSKTGSGQAASSTAASAEAAAGKTGSVRTGSAKTTSTEAGSGGADADGRPRLVRRLVVGGGLAAFAVIAGLALAQGLGERGVGDGLTGAVDPSSRTQVMECQAQGAGPEGDLLGAIKCFDQVLTVDPDNAEALAYRGWYLLLAAGSVQQGSGPGDTVPSDDLQALIDGGLDYLTRAIEADATLPDPLAFRAVAYDRLGRSADACADVVALRALNPPPFFLQQTSALAERNGC